jgi:hypothetical protein
MLLGFVSIPKIIAAQADANPNCGRKSGLQFPSSTLYAIKDGNRVS